MKPNAAATSKKLRQNGVMAAAILRDCDAANIAKLPELLRKA
jgi:hypothetical protein